MNNEMLVAMSAQAEAYKKYQQELNDAIKLCKEYLRSVLDVEWKYTESDCILPSMDFYAEIGSWTNDHIRCSCYFDWAHSPQPLPQFGVQHDCEYKRSSDPETFLKDFEIAKKLISSLKNFK